MAYVFSTVLTDLDEEMTDTFFWSGLIQWVGGGGLFKGRGLNQGCCLFEDLRYFR